MEENSIRIISVCILAKRAVKLAKTLKARPADEDLIIRNLRSQKAILKILVTRTAKKWTD